MERTQCLYRDVRSNDRNVHPFGSTTVLRRLLGYLVRVLHVPYVRTRKLEGEFCRSSQLGPLTSTRIADRKNLSSNNNDHDPKWKEMAHLRVKMLDNLPN
jgi:hypothetical protein